MPERRNTFATGQWATTDWRAASVAQLLGVEMDSVSQNCAWSKQAGGIVHVGVGFAFEKVLDDFAFGLGFREVRLDDRAVVAGEACRARE